MERPLTPAEAWDARYAAAAGGLFGEAPNAWLVEIASRPDFAARTALLPADGDGRNGTWLAGRGIAVTAVDLSAEATRRARLRDRAAGVPVERIVGDLAGWSPGARRWEAAAILYLQGPEALRHRTVRLAAEALAPGGWLILEGFATAQSGRPMGPDDPAKLWDLGRLLAWLPRLTPVAARTERVRLDEGPRHRGEAEVVRLAARAFPGCRAGLASLPGGPAHGHG